MSEKYTETIQENKLFERIYKEYYGILRDLDSTLKCNSTCLVRGQAAVASWLSPTNQSKRSTNERLHAADP